MTSGLSPTYSEQVGNRSDWDGRWKARRSMLGDRGEGQGQKVLDCKQLQQRDFALDFY